MRALIQRVKSASVTVDNEVVSSINHGLLVLVGLTHTDDSQHLQHMAKKLMALRLWPSTDAAAKPWSANVIDVGGQVLLVSQFTLYSVLKGNKPDFHKAMSPAAAKPLYEQLVQLVSAEHKRLSKRDDGVRDGRFGAMMDVQLVNDGPVTLSIDTDDMQLKPTKPPRNATKTTDETGDETAAQTNGSDAADEVNTAGKQ